MHTMIVGFNENYNDSSSLSTQVEKFGDLDTIGIKNNKISLYDRFMDDVKFVNGQYEVRLPFKEDHPLIDSISCYKVKSIKNQPR